MDAKTGQDKFKQADALFRQGHYEAALKVLSELNVAFPNTKNVMYPATLCLEKLGRIEEAKQLCYVMIRQFDCQKARELLNHLEVAPRIAKQHAAPVSVDLIMPERTKPAPPAAARSNKNLYIIIAAIAGVLLVLSLPLLLSKGATAPAAAGNAEPTGLFFPVIAVILFFYVFSCYLMMRICINAGSEPGILIWVPILQVVPIMRAADMSFWWILAIFIPFIGGILFSGVLWVKLCQACNKPAWMGIFIFIPILNLFLMLHLAFSKS